MRVHCTTLDGNWTPRWRLVTAWLSGQSMRGVNSSQSPQYSLPVPLLQKFTYRLISKSPLKFNIGKTLYLILGENNILLFWLLLIRISCKQVPDLKKQCNKKFFSFFWWVVASRLNYRTPTGFTFFLAYSMSKWFQLSYSWCKAGQQFSRVDIWVYAKLFFEVRFAWWSL